ncbi:hypothetical protein MRB53_002630 [Persea americana]|uniref:Uncharacterized protein n=1 Tax=Persea americana TaxID=3435 RepID=A0ACC2MXF3_PERAE|nr:hypothetical protein MRB53_002630 [Persea americana]
MSLGGRVEAGLRKVAGHRDEAIAAARAPHFCGRLQEPPNPTCLHQRRSSVEDVRLIYVEAPILFAKACELFILKLTIWLGFHAKENKSGTLQKKDIAAAITRSAKSWHADWPASSSRDRSGLCSAHQRQRQQGWQPM